jgi:hypothetical protein
MRKRVATVLTVAGVVLASLLSNCTDHQWVMDSQKKGEGVALLKISILPNSPFSRLAKTAVLIISAPDMLTMTKTLTITDSSVQGTIDNIPAGKHRLFEALVYDSTEVVQYRGSAYADVMADSTVRVSISIIRVGGKAIINGAIIDTIETTPDIARGLSVYYPFNGNANDESGHGYDATVKGAILTADRFDNPQRAYFFSGGGGMVASVNSQLSVSAFTIAAWFKSNGIESSGVPRIASITKPSECNGYYELLYANGHWMGSSNDYSKKLICYLDDPASSIDYNLYYSKSITDTIVWHHGAITFENGNLKFYIDGVFDNVVAGLRPLTQFTSGVLEVGYCEGGGNFNGKIDEVRIYNRALSDNEIQMLYSLVN